MRTEASPGRPAPAGVGGARTVALAHLGEPLPLHRLAGSAAMSVRTFTRRFREETGQSPHTWLAAQRVALARRLLETTDLPVERIAVDAGSAPPPRCASTSTRRSASPPAPTGGCTGGPQGRGVGG